MKLKGILWAIVLIGMIALSFLMFSALLAVACWAFSWTFSWKMAIGAYVLFVILYAAFNGNSGRSY